MAGVELTLLLESAPGGASRRWPTARGRAAVPASTGVRSRQPLPAGWSVEPMVQVRLDSGDLVELPAGEYELTDLLSRMRRWCGARPGTTG